MVGAGPVNVVVVEHFHDGAAGVYRLRLAEAIEHVEIERRLVETIILPTVEAVKRPQAELERLEAARQETPEGEEPPPPPAPYEVKDAPLEHPVFEEIRHVRIEYRELPEVVFSDADERWQKDGKPRPVDDVAEEQRELVRAALEAADPGPQEPAVPQDVDATPL